MCAQWSRAVLRTLRLRIERDAEGRSEKISTLQSVRFVLMINYYSRFAEPKMCPVDGKRKFKLSYRSAHAGRGDDGTQTDK